MKHFLLTTVAAFGFVGVASAADLPARMPVKAPPLVAPVFSWTGWYIGGYVGGAFSDGDVTSKRVDVLNSDHPTFTYGLDSSVIGGGNAGM